ncbi:hypothetical protein Tco_1467386 [Tanacetum coccineum]
MDLNFAADGDLRELSAEEAWKTIENFAQGQKEGDKPFKAITKQELASLRTQANELFGNEKVLVEMPITFIQEITNRIIVRKIFQENEARIFTDPGDGVRIILDGVTSLQLYLMRRSPRVLRKFHGDDSWITI